VPEIRSDVNILFLDQFSGLAGGQQCLCDLLPAIIARGWNARVGLPGGGPLHARIAEMGIPVDEIPIGAYTNGTKMARDMFRFAARSPQLAAEIKKLIRKHDIDIVYVNGPRLLPAVALVSRKLVFHSHSLLAPGYASLLAGLSLRARGGMAIASSRFTARPLERCGVPVHVVYNGVLDYSRDARSGSRDRRIGMIGRIAPEKGQADFVRAARILNASASNFRFTIAGNVPGEHNAYADEARDLARGLPFEFLDWQENVGEVLDQLDALALPSAATDATPRVIMEAFSAGVPVIAYPSGGIPELIEHGENGILTRERTPESLAQALGKFFANPESMDRVIRNGRRSYEALFRVERFRNEVVAILERL
jgi:glycosyltransferase involved in cell wall biosynthesis